MQFISVAMEVAWAYPQVSSVGRQIFETNFFRRDFFRRVVTGEVIWGKMRNKNGFTSGGMLSRKFFQNLDTLITILALFDKL